MSITQGLFSDVLANAPGGGTADWSKTLPMAGAVDWTKVTPFQVINPLTGYNYGSTQGTAAPAKPAEAEAPQMSEYQKWLAQQSKPAQYESGGGGRDAAPTSNLTDAQWAAVMENRNINGWNNPYDMAGLKSIGSAALGMLTGNPFAGMGQAYSFAKDQQSALDNLMAQKDAYTQAAQAQRAAEAAAMAQNDYFSSIGVPTNSAMSMMSQQDMNALNSELASYANMSGGGGSANDSYSGSPGGESSGGSYAGGDFGYSGADRGSYF